MKRPKSNVLVSFSVALSPKPINLSIDYLLRDGCWKRVEQQGQEQCCDEQNQGDDDVLLVVPPYQVEEAFERIDKP